MRLWIGFSFCASRELPPFFRNSHFFAIGFPRPYLDECSLSNYTFDLGDVLMRHALSEEASAPGLQRGRAAHVGTPSQIANRAEEAYGTRCDLAGLVRRSQLPTRPG